MTSFPQGYTLVKKIGQGGFSEVYHAKKDDKDYAIKIIDLHEVKKKFPNQESVLKKLRYEFWVLKDIDHPNIVRIFDFGQMPEGNLYLAQELISGVNFKVFCRGLSFGQLQNTFMQMLSALSAIHDWGIIHGDIKAENILIATHKAEPIVKLVDFGLASTATELKINVQHNLSGTPATMAPEIILGTAASTASDIYSLGVVFYEALTQHNPFARGNLNETLKAQLSFIPQPLGLTRSDIPPLWASVVEKMLAKNPVERPSARQILDTIKHKQFTPVPAPFIGRQQELSCVTLLAQAIQNKKQLALCVEGQSGVGIRRFLKEVFFRLLLIDPEFRTQISRVYENEIADKMLLLINRGPAPQTHEALTLTLNAFSHDEIHDWLAAVLSLKNIPQPFLTGFAELSQGIPQIMWDMVVTLAERKALTDSQGHVTQATLTLVNFAKIFGKDQGPLATDHAYLLEQIIARVRQRNLGLDDSLWRLIESAPLPPQHSANEKMSRRGQVLCLKGACLINHGNFGKAREHLLSALELLKQQKHDIVFALRTQNYLAYTWLRQDNTGEAINLYEDSLRQMQQLTKAQALTITNLDLGAAYLGAQRFVEAQERLTQELALSEKTQTPEKKMSCLYNLGLAANGLKNFKKAATYFLDVVTLARGEKDTTFLLHGLNGLANALSRANEDDKAIAFYGEAHELALALGDITAGAVAVQNRGRLWFKKARLEDAKKDMEASQTLLNQLKELTVYEKKLLCKTHMELGKIAITQENLSQAQQNLERAWHRAEADEALSSERFDILVARCHLWQKMGNKEFLTRDSASLNYYAGDDANKKELAHEIIQKIEKSPTLNKSALSPPDSNPMATQAWQSPLKKILEITHQLIIETPLADLLEKIVAYAIDLTGAEMGVLITLDDKDGLVPRASVNIKLDQNLTEMSCSVARRVLATGQAIVTADAINDTHLNQFASVINLNLKSILGLPIRFRGMILGVLYLSHRFRAALFSTAIIETAQAYADQAGLALKNHELLEHYKKTAEDLSQELDDTRVDLVRAKAELENQTTEISLRLDKQGLITRSAHFITVIQQAEKLAATPLSVVVLGESGSGKEVLARYIHQGSPRRQNPFIAINCGALPQNLVESELFGHKKGAFTGAEYDKVGLIEAAHTGTLFLDEITDLPLDTQVKFLRVLQEKEIMRLGETRSRNIDVRVIAASFKNLAEAVKKKVFREDLYYRLAAAEITVPALREHVEDIPLLAQHFLRSAQAANNKKNPAAISPEFLKILMGYAWPGNVRELKNVIDVGFALCAGKILKTEDLPKHLAERLIAAERSQFVNTAGGTAGWYDPRLSWKEHELRIYASALAALGFDIPRTASSLKVGTATVYKWMRDHRLRETQDFWRDKILPYEENTSLENLRRHVFTQAMSRHPGHPYHVAQELKVAPVTVYRYGGK